MTFIISVQCIVCISYNVYRFLLLLFYQLYCAFVLLRLRNKNHTYIQHIKDRKIVSISAVMDSQKGGPGARNVRGGQYLVFQGKAISKKKVIVIGNLFLVHENKVTLKKIFILRGATVKCSKALGCLKKLSLFLEGHFLVYQNNVIFIKKIFI